MGLASNPIGLLFHFGNDFEFLFFQAPLSAVPFFPTNGHPPFFNGLLFTAI
jgi:hypothetical protein